MDSGIHWGEDGNLLVQLQDVSVEYPRNTANQIILCARMNPWDVFMALLEKKTDAQLWSTMNQKLLSLDKQAAWKMKESFARLTTHEN